MSDNRECSLGGTAPHQDDDQHNEGATTEMALRYGASSVGAHVIDGDGTILWANAAGLEELGYSAEEFIGRPIAAFYADAGAGERIRNRLAARQTIDQLPANLLRKDGSVRKCVVCATASYSHAGRLLHARCITLDPTEAGTAGFGQELLVKASQALSQSLDRDQTLNALAQHVVPRFADWYAVHLINEQGDVTISHISHEDSAKAQRALRALERWTESIDGRSAPAHVIRTGKSVLASTVEPEALAETAHDSDHLALLELAGIHSVIVVPLSLPDRPIGSMAFVSAESRREYSTSDLAVAEALANRVALALANARLHQQATEARANAEHAAHRLAILVKANESLASALGPDEALEQLAEFSVPTLADYCVTYRLDPDGRVHRVGLVQSDPDIQRQLTELNLEPPSLDEGYGIGPVLRTGESVLLEAFQPETLETFARSENHLGILRNLDFQSAMFVPLKARGHIVGGASFATTRYSMRRYNQSDLALAEEMTSRVALLVDNARLYDEARLANRAREEMLSIVAHDLRNPLNTIVTSSHLIGLGGPAEQNRAANQNIQRAVTHMSRLLDDLLDLTRIDAGRLSITPASTDLAELVSETIAMHRPVAEQKEVRLELLDLVPVQATVDPSRVMQALSNLVDNAVRFTPAGGAVQVRVENAGDRARITVRDSGPGIAAEHLPRLFDRFWRSDQKRAGGLGLGLAIARGIATAHGGDIEVTSEPARGSTFSLILPLHRQGDPGGVSDAATVRG